MVYPYVYTWSNNLKRAALKGRRCRVLARLAMNSAVIEFENGQRECVSRNALRRRRLCQSMSTCATSAAQSRSNG